jgi:hypothetical protein
MTQEDVEKLVPQIDQVMNVEKIDDWTSKKVRLQTKNEPEFSPEFGQKAQHQWVQQNFDSKEDKTRSETNQHLIYNDQPKLWRKSPLKYVSSHQIKTEADQKPASNLKYSYGSNTPAPMSDSCLREAVAKQKEKERKRKRDKKLEIGMRFLSTHKRRSKVDHNRKRDKKWVVKVAENLTPDYVKSSVQANFKKMKKSVETFQEPKMMYPQKTFMGSKRTLLLLNKENLPSNIK